MLEKNKVFEIIEEKGWISLLINDVEIHFSDRYKNQFYDEIVQKKNLENFICNVLENESIWFTIAGNKDGQDFYMQSRYNKFDVSDKPLCFIPETFYNEKPLYNMVANDYVLSSMKFLEPQLQNVRKKYYESKEVFDCLFKNKIYLENQEFVFNGYHFELKEVERPKINGIHIVGVRFLNQSSGYYSYYGDNSIYNLGDRVVVPTGNNGDQIGTVVFRKIYQPGEPLPFGGNLKSVIRKL
ncbi:MAG: hypothetical protein IKB42_02715 [Clostridia bacterium]|nr:hypothetical protein [Clostridia bacterium]